MKTSLLALCITFTSFAKVPVWIDYDVSYGKIIRDVDDGFALITALNSTELIIKGISYGFGNISNPKYMHKITKKILKKLNKEHIPIYPGAKNRNEIFKITAATLGMKDALRKNKLKILTMGRLSNVASVIKNFPHLKKNIDEVIINAGRMLEYETYVGKQNVIMPDTNVDDHLEAVKYVLESGVKITMIPTEIMQNQFITKDHLKQMRKGKSISRWMANNSIVWRWIWKFFPNSQGFIPWDVFIVTYLTHRNEMSCHENIPISLEYLKNNTSSLFRKKYKKSHKFFLVASFNLNSNFIGNYCYKMSENHLQNIVDSWIAI